MLLLRAYNIYNCRLRYVAVSTSLMLVFLRFHAGDIYATTDGERVPLRQIIKNRNSVSLVRIAQPTTSSVCFPQTRISACRTSKTAFHNPSARVCTGVLHLPFPLRCVPLRNPHITGCYQFINVLMLRSSTTSHDARLVTGE